MYLADDASNFTSIGINLFGFSVIPHMIVVSMNVSEIVANPYTPLIRTLTSRM